MYNFFDKFLLISAIPHGCFVCDYFDTPKAQIFDSVEDLVNHFHDMMDNKTEHIYPVDLRLLDHDGTMLNDKDGDIMMKWHSGCFSNGLVGVDFYYNGLKYKVRRGQRK